MSSTARASRIAAQMQRSLAELLRRDVKDPRVGNVTSPRCRWRADLSVARIHSFCRSEWRTPAMQVLSGLRSAAGFLRGELARDLKLRHAPRLEFQLDTDIERAQQLTRADRSRGQYRPLAVRDSGGAAGDRRGTLNAAPAAGLLLLDKPVGLSSNAALQTGAPPRRRHQGRPCGSLDPLASGMLPICLGEATRLAGELLEGPQGVPLRPAAGRALGHRATPRARSIERGAGSDADARAPSRPCCSSSAGRSSRCRRCIRRSSVPASRSIGWHARRHGRARARARSPSMSSSLLGTGRSGAGAARAVLQGHLRARAGEDIARALGSCGRLDTAAARLRRAVRAASRMVSTGAARGHCAASDLAAAAGGPGRGPPAGAAARFGAGRRRYGAGVRLRCRNRPRIAVPAASARWRLYDAAGAVSGAGAQHRCHAAGAAPVQRTVDRVTPCSA